MRLFIGLDVSLTKTAICVISEHGTVFKETEVMSEPDVLVRWLGNLDGSAAAIGLEAGPLSQWLHRGLTEAGLDAVVMETRQVKGALNAMPIKTDRRDAEGVRACFISAGSARFIANQSRLNKPALFSVRGGPFSKTGSHWKCRCRGFCGTLV